MPDLPRQYWDTCVFLSYVNGLPDRLPEIDALLEEARQKRLEIITSTITFTEVAYGAMGQTGRALDQGTDEAIDQLWTPPSPVQVVEFYRSVAYRAKALVRRGVAESRKLRPMDAIHLATALELEAQEFNTYDRDLLRWNAHIPELLIRQPIATMPQLPTTGRSGTSDGTSRTS